MVHFLRRSALILVLVAGFVGALTAPALAAPHVLAIARARTLPLGTVVTVDGTATAPSGWLESSSFDKGFALQDKSSGIYVSVAADPGIAVRDRVRVTGTLEDRSGLLILAVADLSAVRVHGHGPQVRPLRLATGAVNEASEGRLVRVVATITQAPVSDLPFGFLFSVDDGSGELTIFVSTQAGIDLSHLTVGQRVTVTGFSGQFDTHYEIDPRFPADLSV